MLFWAIEGPAQGCILTITVTIMSNWFPASMRGKVMGVWGSNASVGNIVGEWITTVIHESFDLPWQVVVIVCATFLGFAGAGIYFSIESKPPTHEISNPLLHPPMPSLNFWDAWKEPGVTYCALSYACVKLLHYGFVLWLPFYLSSIHQMEMTEIGLLATMYDLGGIFGSISAGFISDKIKFRSIVVETMICIAVPLILIFRLISTEEKWAFYFIVPLIGMMIGGSANIISTAVAADLSIDVVMKKPRATIVGIINGTGSLGAASGQILVISNQIGWLQSFSWSAVFLFLIGKS